MDSNEQHMDSSSFFFWSWIKTCMWYFSLIWTPNSLVLFSYFSKIMFFHFILFICFIIAVILDFYICLIFFHLSRELKNMFYIIFSDVTSYFSNIIINVRLCPNLGFIWVQKILWGIQISNFDLSYMKLSEWCTHLWTNYSTTSLLFFEIFMSGLYIHEMTLCQFTDFSEMF